MTRKKASAFGKKGGFQPIDEGYQPTTGQSTTSTTSQGAQTDVPTVPAGGTAQSAGTASTNAKTDKK